MKSCCKINLMAFFVSSFSYLTQCPLFVPKLLLVVETWGPSHVQPSCVLLYFFIVMKAKLGDCKTSYIGVYNNLCPLLASTQQRRVSYLPLLIFLSSSIDNMETSVYKDVQYHSQMTSHCIVSEVCIFLTVYHGPQYLQILLIIFDNYSIYPQNVP